MKLDKFVLAQNMAFLISIPPESNLAKLLAFCLTTKAGKNTPGTKILEMTYDLIENPSKLPYWTQDIMGQDLDYTTEEWKALANMGIKDANDFMATLWQELENLSL
ncbi:hypothetical protein CDG77_29870 [Nostoc sp. 'Peltigera membranacea cyanobiont' 213]|uniref:hypothetical protein n=1 Tax=unclassified Nostoc TaxID=2593658 RepID=UPI000B95738D|nr:hypothetical protein [Nostoc sp. 'Peltigera membranacea cyanobiont' 213]OYD87345.1 hypothetical protein CDG77_29870 [Nostoc sp. 'Peltigera membranacea cyanobiont' 213]